LHGDLIPRFIAMRAWLLQIVWGAAEGRCGDDITPAPCRSYACMAIFSRALSPCEHDSYRLCGAPPRAGAATTSPPPRVGAMLAWRSYPALYRHASMAPTGCVGATEGRCGDGITPAPCRSYACMAILEPTTRPHPNTDNPPTGSPTPPAADWQ